MNSRSTQRMVNDDLALVAPLSGPSYGAYSVARRRWRKSLPAIIADAMANCRAVSARLSRGMYMPDEEGKPHYQDIFNQLSRSTDQQLKALEAFSKINWRE
jgi:hypothetical protein